MKKYEELEEALKKLITEQISSGNTNTALPTEQELCTRFSISRQTVRKAMEDLRKQGLIQKRQGSGAYMTGLLPDAAQNSVAVLVADLEEYTYPVFLSDLQRSLASSGFTTVPYATSRDFYKERMILETLCKNPPRCIVCECFSNCPDPNSDLFTKLQEAGSILIWLNKADTDTNSLPHFSNHTFFLQTNDFDGCYRACARLAALSRKRIGGVFLSDTPRGSHFYSGMLSFLRDEELPFSSNQSILMTLSGFSSGASFPDLHSLISSCNAIICQNDLIASVVWKILERQGLRIPEDIALVSFDRSYLAGSAFPSIRLSVPYGRATADFILSIIGGRPPKADCLLWESSAISIQ